MQPHSAWLSHLKIPQLHRLAVLLGTSCSGTKSTRIAAINDALSLHQRRTSDGGDSRNSRNRQSLPSDRVSLVSIDMGIRNLAFAHLTTKLQPAETGGLRQYGPVTLSSWRKIDVSKSDGLSTQNVKKTKVKETVKEVLGVDASGDFQPGTKDLSVEKPLGVKGNVAESFDPAVYAGHAFNIVRSIVDQYKPTHVVIERQRFRSGGSTAVLEWTIRVGVFEGMLYAVLKTLYGIEVMSGPAPIVEGILPMRVNRFWLEGGNATSRDEVSSEDTSESKTKVKMKGKEVKKAKIEVVGRLLENSRHQTNTSVSHHVLPFKPGKDVQDLVDYFRSEVERPGNSRRKKAVGAAKLPDEVQVSKLDDLADCLLQGLAWMNWQNNLAKTHARGEMAFDLTGGMKIGSGSRARKSSGSIATTGT